MLIPAAEQKERIARKRDTLLKFLAGEGFSSLPILAEVLQLGKPATCKTLQQLAKLGMVSSQDVPAGAGMLKVYFLTAHGRAMAADPDQIDQDWKDVEVSRISPSTIGHALDCQRLRLTLEASGWTGWKTDRQLHAMQLPKVPDGLATTPAGQLAAVEVERTIKTKKRYSAILAEYVLMLNSQKIHEIHYFSPVPGVAERVERIFKSIGSITIKTTTFQVQPAWLERFYFQPFPTKKEF